MSVITPNMKLVQPTIGVDSGLTWEQAVNANSTIVNGHNHTSGNGVPIPPAGLNISSALTMQNNFLTNAAGISFTPQNTTPPINTIYVNGVDLYFYDGNADTPIQITKSGSVNATSSGISSGTASAAFSSGILVVDSASNTPANIKAGSILIGQNVSGSNFITLQPPSALSSGSYSLVLPAIPASSLFLTLDTSGNIATAGSIQGTQIASSSLTGSQMAAGTITGTQIANGTITPAKLSTVGYTAGGSVTVTAAANTPASPAVSGLSVTLTTTGAVVKVTMQSTATNTTWSAGAGVVTPSSTCWLILVRDGSTVVSTMEIGTSAVSPSSIVWYDTGASAASHTYTVQCMTQNSSGGTCTFNQIQLVAYELA